jgi:Asp/Glu/hydantoin racemase
MLHNLTPKPTIGIFEASVQASIQLLRPGQEFGIVSTGDVWKQILGDEIRQRMLGPQKAAQVFAGVETCGLNAGELHGHGEVERRVKDATRRLLDSTDGSGGGGLGAVVLGCAGMAGMEGWVRDVAGEGVRVVDGVRAGVGVLQGLVRGGF